MRYQEAEALAAENANRVDGPYYVICKAIPTAPAGCEYEACDPRKAWEWAQRDGWHLAAEIRPVDGPPAVDDFGAPYSVAPDYD